MKGLKEYVKRNYFKWALNNDKYVKRIEEKYLSKKRITDYIADSFRVGEIAFLGKVVQAGTVKSCQLYSSSNIFKITIESLIIRGRKK